MKNRHILLGLSILIPGLFIASMGSVSQEQVEPEIIDLDAYLTELEAYGRRNRMMNIPSCPPPM